jgi:hypothetical protein
MTETLVLALLGGGMLGWGLMLDRLPGLGGPVIERLARALIMGFGILGWLTFFPALFHHLETPVLAVVPGAGLPGLWLLRGLGLPRLQRFTVWTWTLATLIATLALGDFLEGLSPPADADSMAYHFATPKLFLKEGGLIFIPRASDGAAPLLPQMTYMLALGLGGERALTLWCMLSGWLLPFATYAYGRRHLDRDWALALAAAVMSLPTILYNAGTGQVEVRTAAFCLVAAFAATDALKGAGWRAAILAGMATGLFVGSKFTGLLFAASVGPVLLLGGPGRFTRAIAFGLGVLIVGSQWYGWNWGNTGDPVYPMLFGLMPYHQGVPWNAAQNDYMKTVFFGSEMILPRTLFWWAIYPLRVLLDGNSAAFEAGRTGLGPLPLLLAPFALAGAWRYRGRVAASPLTPVIAIALIYYSLWFSIGTSQRIRHYVPVIAIALVVMTVAAERATRGRPSRSPMVTVMLIALALQLAAQGLTALNHGRRLVLSESRESFLVRNLPGFKAVREVDATLPPGAKVMTYARELIYLFKTPVFYAHHTVEPRINLRDDGTASTSLLLSQLRGQGITHVLAGPSSKPSLAPVEGDHVLGLMALLAASGCAPEERRIETGAPRQSRTLMVGDGSSVFWHLLSITPTGC